jgi:peptide/nickel transport system substrate-binding protein
MGGTLRIGVAHFLTPYFEAINASRFLDPQAPFSVSLSGQRELLRCCLARTLLSYTGQSTADGGTVLHPDLAIELPEISDDALTWTFHIQEGIRYAPPLEDLEVTTPDIVRALERTATLEIGTEEYMTVYEPIEGVREFADKETSTISGLETPDPHTLVVHLTEVTNDLGYRFALPATAPIPPDPSDPSARFGVAEGHEDGYGRFLVSSGPYMIEGSEDLDPSLPPEKQQPVSGLVKGESLTMVRNPSWSRSTDDLRKAYVDRVELTTRPRRQAWRAVERGTLDVVFDGSPSPEELERYETSPALRDRLHREWCNYVNWASMRMTAPPFDDIHVRRAANYAVDVERVAELSASFQWGPAGYIQTAASAHIAPDSTEADLLAGWDPYPYDVAKAREEMSESRYDADGDGLCDHPSCRGVVTLESNFGPEPLVDAAWEEGFEAIGIKLEIQRLDLGPLIKRTADPTGRASLNLVTLWEAEYPSPARLFELGFDVPGVGSFLNWDYSLLGATPDQLEAWGYPTTAVPSVSNKIDECNGRFGPAQQQCWAELDQLLMLEIVPAIPYIICEEIRLVSERVTRFSLDQAFGAAPALDQIALSQG